ncbi:hypothetical protein OF83DRAFT_1111450 [Amylostereum chailletii]|nr:hypothetical protein OF83DRAFT_1111450 [Amylostereum chailletii]
MANVRCEQWAFLPPRRRPCHSPRPSFHACPYIYARLPFLLRLPPPSAQPQKPTPRPWQCPITPPPPTRPCAIRPRATPAIGPRAPTPPPPIPRHPTPSRKSTPIPPSPTDALSPPQEHGTSASASTKARTAASKPAQNRKYTSVSTPVRLSSLPLPHCLFSPAPPSADITSSSIPLSNPNYWRRVYPPLTSTEPAPPDGLNDPPSRHHHHAPQFLPNPSQPYPSHSHSQSYSSPQPYLPSVQPQPAPIPSARRASASASTHSRPDMTSASLSIDPHRAHRPSSMVAYPYGTDPAAVAPNAYDSRAAGGRGHGYDPYAAQSAPSAQTYGAAPGHGYAQPHQPSPPYSAHGRSTYAPY